MQDRLSSETLADIHLFGYATNEIGGSGRAFVIFLVANGTAGSIKELRAPSSSSSDSAEG
jgi:hypothetical protein